MSPEQEGFYTGYDYVAEHMKVSPQELVGTYQGIADSGIEFTEDDLADLALEMGIDAPRVVSEELSDAQTEITPTDPRHALMRTVSFALSAAAYRGNISFPYARFIAEDVLTDEAVQHHFLAQLYETEAMREHHIAGRSRDAVKLAKKAISHAHKSGLEPDLLLGVRHTETLILFESGRFEECIPKAKTLWALVEKMEDKSAWARDHNTRQSVLRQWRSSLLETGQLFAAMKVQQMMYDYGYVPETGEEYKARIIRDYPEYSHLK